MVQLFRALQLSHLISDNKVKYILRIYFTFILYKETYNSLIKIYGPKFKNQISAVPPANKNSMVKEVIIYWWDDLSSHSPLVEKRGGYLFNFCHHFSSCYCLESTSNLRWKISVSEFGRRAPCWMEVLISIHS